MIIRRLKMYICSLLYIPTAACSACPSSSASSAHVFLSHSLSVIWQLGLWLAEDGMKMQSFGSQAWDCAIATQVVLASGMEDEYGDCLQKAHFYLKEPQGLVTWKQRRYTIFLRTKTDESRNIFGSLSGAAEKRKGSNDAEKMMKTLHDSSLNFKYSTLEKATASFDESNKLGQGGFGTVYKCRRPQVQSVHKKMLSLRLNQVLYKFAELLILDWLTLDGGCVAIGIGAILL